MLLTPVPASVRQARQAVTGALIHLRREDLIDDATVIATELVANAVIHARTEITLSVGASGAGVRLRVTDYSDILPRWSSATPTATSGRGLLLVQRLSKGWGVEPLGDSGKVVWAQIDHPAVDTAQDVEGDLLGLWGGQPWPSHHLPDAGIEVVVDIDVQAMLESRAHTDDLVRDLQLTLLDTTRDCSPDVIALARSVELAIAEFHEPRRQMYNQTLSAARHQHARTTLHLLLHSADAAAATRWLAALDEAEALIAAGVLQLPPFPTELQAFRRQYIAAIVKQLQAGGRSDYAANR